MNKQDEPQDFFDKPQNIKLMLRVFYGVCVVLVLVDFLMLVDLIEHRHIYHSWEKIPAFYAIYGFVGCVVLVLVAKEMRKFLMRKEDYYDE